MYSVGNWCRKVRSDREIEVILSKVEEWYDEFFESEFFNSLSDRQKDYSKDVIMAVTEYMYYYHQVDPVSYTHLTLPTTERV